ncbi:MAG TPA: DUF3618 domain-containing protein [Rubrobacter sp.]|nr:DUF3618 domain-containing protein [Rubrobacter sp.]
MAEEPEEMNQSPTPEEKEELKRRAESDDDVEAARANVELTRAEMTDTVDALQEKLDPKTLKEEAKSTARDTGARVVESTKQNPAVPVAVAGGLLGLLLVRRWLRGRGRRSDTVVIDLRRGRIRTY